MALSFMNIICKGERGGWAGSRTKCAFILGREAYLGFYVGECPVFSKYW
jgi:hypothetical protein